MSSTSKMPMPFKREKKACNVPLLLPVLILIQILRLHFPLLHSRITPTSPLPKFASIYRQTSPINRSKTPSTPTPSATLHIPLPLPFSSPGPRLIHSRRRSLISPLMSCSIFLRIHFAHVPPVPARRHQYILKSGRRHLRPGMRRVDVIIVGDI